MSSQLPRARLSLILVTQRRQFQSAPHVLKTKPTFYTPEVIMHGGVSVLRDCSYSSANWSFCQNTSLGRTVEWMLFKSRSSLLVPWPTNFWPYSAPIRCVIWTWIFLSPETLVILVDPIYHPILSCSMTATIYLPSYYIRPTARLILSKSNSIWKSIYNFMKNSTAPCHPSLSPFTHFPSVLHIHQTPPVRKTSCNPSSRP